MALIPWNYMAILQHVNVSPPSDRRVDIPPEMLLSSTVSPCGWLVAINNDGEKIAQLYIVELHGVGGRPYVSVDDLGSTGGGRRRSQCNNGESGGMGEKEEKEEKEKRVGQYRMGKMVEEDFVVVMVDPTR